MWGGELELCILGGGGGGGGERGASRVGLVAIVQLLVALKLQPCCWVPLDAQVRLER